MPARFKPILMLLCVAAFWGFATPIIKATLPYFDTITFLTYRFFICSLILIPLVLLIEPDTWHVLGQLKHSEWLLLITCSVIGSAIQLGLLFWGLNLTTSIDGSIINSTSPILVTIAGHYLLKERITGWHKIGLLISFFGSVIIIIQPILETGKFFTGTLAGNFLVLLGTLAWVIYVILTKRELKHKISPLVLTTSMFFWGFVFMTPLNFLQKTPATFIREITKAPFLAHMGVIYMVLFSGILAYWLYQQAQKEMSVSKADVFLFLPPLFTTPLAHYWLKEPITPSFIVGALVITLGIVIVEFRGKRAHNVI